MHSPATVSTLNDSLIALNDDRVPKPKQKDLLEKATVAFEFLQTECDWIAIERGKVDLPRLAWRMHKVFKRNPSAHKSQLNQLQTWLQALENAGYLWAGRYLAVLARNGGDYEGAISRLSRLATAATGDNDTPGVWFEAGYTVLLQHGLNADAIRTNDAGQGVLPEQAVVFFEKAAALGDAESHYYLSQHWYAKAQDQDDATDAQAHRETAEEHTIRAADPKIGDPSPQALLDHARILRQQNDWNGAWKQALDTIDKTPEKIKRNTRFKARWFAAWVAHDAPPGELVDWPGVLEKVMEFQSVIGERPDKAAEFAKLLTNIQTMSQEAPPQFPTEAAQAIRDLPHDYETLSIAALFSRNKADRQPAQRAAFARVLGLLSGSPQDNERAVSLLDKLADWSKALQDLGVFYARDVANDAGLMWLRGEALFKLARYFEAFAVFAKAAKLKPGDPQHVGMCYERMGALQLVQNDYVGAAAAFLKGFSESAHPGLLLQFATAKLTQRPANNASPMLHLLRYFIEKQPAVIADKKKETTTVAPWQYTGHDPAMQTLPQITIPVDGKPDKTALRYAMLTGIWAKALLGDPNENHAYRDARAFAAQTLAARILEHPSTAPIPHDLISMAAQMADASFLEKLMACSAQMSNPAALGLKACAATHRRNLAPLLRSIVHGCSKANWFPDQLLRQALAIVSASPDLIKDKPSAARELCALIWRATLSRYVRGISGSHDQAKAFRDWMAQDVLPQVAGIANAELRRKWFFELVVSDKASVEYALARQVVEEAQDIFKPLVSSSSLVDARDWLSRCGSRAADALAFGLILDAEKWLPRAYGATDTDTGDWAIEALSKGVYKRMHQSFKNSDIHFASAWKVSPFIQLEPMCAAEVASATVRTSADLLNPNRLAEWGFKENPHSVSVEFFATSDAARPIRMRANLALNRALAQRELQGICDHILNIYRSANPSFSWPTNRTSVTFEADVGLTTHGPVLPQDWLNFLNAVKQEYMVYRTTGIPLNDFFDRAWQTFPNDIESSYGSPADYLANWSWVLQTVCDRFWGMFMTRIVNGEEAERSALELIHDLKKDLADLIQANEQRSHNSGDIQQRLAKFRQEIISLDHQADALLGQEISGREPARFDLRATVEHRLLACFGEAATGLLTAPVNSIIVGNRYDFERIVDELLNNAKNHGNLAGVTVEWRTSVDWLVRVNTAARTGQPHNNGLGTGQGMRHARATAADAGYFWHVPTPNPGAPFVATFGCGASES